MNVELLIKWDMQIMIITDAGVLGSKRFVREVFEEIKGLLGSKKERQFVRVIGDAGMYSLKRLQNV